jgi:peroxiredoxin
MAKNLVGQPAKKFTIPNSTGEEYTFDPSATKTPVVLFFYPTAGVSNTLNPLCLRSEFKCLTVGSVSPLGAQKKCVPSGTQ